MKPICVINGLKVEWDQPQSRPLNRETSRLYRFMKSIARILGKLFWFVKSIAHVLCGVFWFLK